MALAAVLTGYFLHQGRVSIGLYAHYMVAAVAYTFMGAFIAPRRPRNAVGWLFVLVGLSSAVVVVGVSYSMHRPMAWLVLWSFPLPFGYPANRRLVRPSGPDNPS